MKMKKRFLSFILIVSFILTIIPVGGVTAYAQNHTHDGIEFDKELDSSFTGGELASGNYVLTTNIVLSSQIVITSGGVVNICMNGFVINANGHRGIYNYGKLSIYNCDNDAVHYFNYKSNSVWTLNDNGATDTAIDVCSITDGTSEDQLVKVSGASIVGAYVNGNSAGVCNEGIITVSGVSFVGHRADNAFGAFYSNKNTTSTFNNCIIAGCIGDAGGAALGVDGLLFANYCLFIGNKITESGSGVLCVAANSYFDNCYFYRNKSVNAGGAIWTNASECICVDCVFENNEAKSDGGAIYVYKGNTKLINVEITSNKAINQGGGVYNNATLIIGGSTKIEDNVGSSVVNNVYLPAGKTVTIDSTNPFTTGAIIGVTTQTSPSGSPIAITGVNGADYSSYFASDIASYGVFNDLNTVKIGSGHIHNGIIFNNSLSSSFTGGKLTAGAYYLTENITLSNTIEIKSGDTVNLCLNGFVINANGACRAINNEGNLAIYDCDDVTPHYFTEITYTQSDFHKGVNDEIIRDTGLQLIRWKWNNDSTPTEYVVTGGVITGAKTDNATNQLGSAIKSTGNLTMSGISIVGNYGERYGMRGAGIYVEGESATLTNCDFIANCAFENGGGLYASGSAIVNVSGGSFKYNSTARTNGASMQADGTSRVTVKNVTFEGNVSSCASGAIEVLKNATVVFENCIIKNNKAFARAGGIESEGNLTLINCEITDNVVDPSNKCTWTGNGAGVALMNGSITLSGKNVITNNKLRTVTDNFYIASGKAITIDSTKPLITGSIIGIVTQVVPATGAYVQVTASNNEDYSQFFNSDKSGYVIMNTGSNSNQIVKLTTVAQAAPVVTKVDETIKNRADGKINNVTTAMEYRKASEQSYTSITSTSITNLAAGEYKVRCKADNYRTASPDTTVTIGYTSTVSVTFNSRGGSAVASQTGLAWHDLVASPGVIPTREYSTFAGWYLSSGDAFDFDTYEVEGDLTLYAHWMLQSTNEEILVPNEYDLNGTTTKIQVISSYGALASQMEDEAVELKRQATSSSILLRVTSEKKQENQVQSQSAVSIKTAASGSSIEFHEITATEFFETSEGGVVISSGSIKVSEADKIIEVIIPFDTTNKGNICIYRYHNDATQTFIESDSREDGTFYIEGGYIHLFTQKFSPYAVGYTTTPTAIAPVIHYVPTFPEELCKKDSTCVYAKFIDSNTRGWYHNGVHFCTERGYIDGEDETHFNPDGILTRGMMVRLLYNLEGRPEVSEVSTFTDVSTGRWFTDAIAWAQDNNVVEGVGDNLFDLEGVLTREQLATLFYKYAKYKGYNTNKKVSITGFADYADVRRYAQDAFSWAVANGIVEGSNGKLNPKGLATRAEAATLLQKFIRTFVK